MADFTSRLQWAETTLLKRWLLYKSTQPPSSLCHFQCLKLNLHSKRAHLRSWNCISQCGTSTKNQPRMMPNFHIFWFFHTFLTGLTISILGQRSQMVVQRNWGTLNIELLVLCLSYTRLCSKILEHLNRTWRKEYVPLSCRSQDSRMITVIKKSDPKHNNFWAVDHKTMALIVRLKSNDWPVLEAYPSRS